MLSLSSTYLSVSVHKQTRQSMCCAFRLLLTPYQTVEIPWSIHLTAGNAATCWNRYLGYDKICTLPSDLLARKGLYFGHVYLWCANQGMCPLDTRPRMRTIHLKSYSSLFWPCDTHQLMHNSILFCMYITLSVIYPKYHAYLLVTF